MPQSSSWRIVCPLPAVAVPEVDGLAMAGTWRAHQVPLGEVRTNPDHLRALEAWMRGYRPEELFVEGRLVPELAALAPAGERRLGANPHANGGLLLHDLFCRTSTTTPSPWTAPAPLSPRPPSPSEPYSATS